MVVSKELIVTDLARRGDGKSAASPVRIITQVYEKSGEMIAEHDPLGSFSVEDLAALEAFLAEKKGSLTEWLAARGRAF